MVQALCKTYEEVSVSYEVKHIPAFDRCTPNQLEMKPISPSIAPLISRVPQNTVKVS